MLNELIKLTEEHDDCKELTIVLTVGELKELLGCKPNFKEQKRKRVYNKYEIQVMLDNNEDITNIILDPSLTDLSFLFRGREDFNQDISGWDVSNIKHMPGMFWGARSFNQDISNWDVSNVEGMYGMFCAATSFSQDISNWNVSNVGNMESMFQGATSFNQDLSSWDVSKGTNMNYMFLHSGYTHNKPKGY